MLLMVIVMKHCSQLCDLYDGMDKQTGSGLLDYLPAVLAQVTRLKRGKKGEEKCS